MHNNSRTSLDGSESAFSLIDRGFVDEADESQSHHAFFDGASGHGGHVAPARQNSYSISSIIANPKAGSTAATISTNLSNLNPLRSTSGPKTGATRGKPAVPIVVSDLPKVARKDLQPYIESIRGEWEEWSKLDALRRRDAAKSGLRGHILETSGGFASSPPSSSKEALPSLDEVPAIFSEENFSLANPRTFEAITESEDFATTASGSASLFRPTDQLLQEKLSHYLDLVEVHLNAEISQRSDSFFSALSNLQDLESQSAAALDRIAALKVSLSDVNTRIAEKGLSIGRRSRKRVRLKQLNSAVSDVIAFWRDMETVEDLAREGRSSDVLDLADELESRYQAGAQIAPDPAHKGVLTADTIQLDRVDSLAETATRLQSIRTTVCQYLQQDALAIAIRPFAIDATSVQGTSTMAGQLAVSLSTAVDAEKLSGLLRNMARCGKESTAAWERDYKASVQRAVFQKLDQLLTQRTRGAAITGHPAVVPSITSSASLSANGSPAPWTQAVHLSHSDFLSLVEEIVDVMTKTFNSVEEQVTKVCSLIDSVTAESSNPTENGEAFNASQHPQLSDTVQVIAEQVHTSIADVVNQRLETHLALSVFDFVALFDAIWSFVLSSETIGRGMLVGLRSVMLAQTKSYLQAFHQAHLNSVGLAIERELWSPADVPARMQELGTLLVQSAVSDPPEFLASAVSDIARGLESTSKQLLIEERSYYVVSATLSAVEALAEYSQLIMKLPILTIDAISKISEFLKQFNSRVCQVVLGAGAMRSAGLKNITARHLALASQSLSLMISLIPYVREALRRHLRAKQAVILVDFDKVKRDFQEHQYEIHSKLVAIMADRLSVHCQTLLELNWNSSAASTDGKPQAYMETLVKETTTLHKVLLRYLPPSSLETVMMQVLSQIGARLAEEYGKIELKSEAAKSRMLVDAQYLKAKFAELKGFDRPLPAAELEALIEAKKVVQPPPLQSQKSFSTPSMTGHRATLSRGRTTSIVRSSVDLGSARPAATAAVEAVARESVAGEPLAADDSDTAGASTHSADAIQTPANSSHATMTLAALTEEPLNDQAGQIKDTAQRAEAVISSETLPQDIPLPPSPTAVAQIGLEVPTTDTSSTENDASAAEAAPLSASTVDKEIKAPATPQKESSDEHHSQKRLEPHSPQPTLPPVPVVNVKNRLASLFSKKQLPARPSDATGAEGARRASVASTSGPTSPPITPERRHSLLHLPEQHVVAASSDVSAAVSTEDLPLPASQVVDEQNST